MLTRRTLLIGAPALAAACATSKPAPDPVEERFHQLCAALGPGNRLGVAVIETGSGRRWSYQADARFAMASTFKVALAAAVLAEVESGRLSLEQEIAYSAADLLDHAPVTGPNVGIGRLSVARLCQAIVEVSDNPAANLLLRRIGGPAGLTAFIRASGDPITRLDRYELELNSNLPGDPRDTTTPAAMAGLLRTLLLGNRLSVENRSRLTGWMIASPTGRERLRAGFPAGWRVGDKTGTGARGANNDLAIAWPPGEGRAPLVIASYVEAPGHDAARRMATHAAVARISAQAAADGRLA